jgi:hypothetical protein
MLLAKTACLGADAAASATHALVVAAVGAARLRADLAAKDAETEVGPDFAARLPFAAANLRLPRTAEAVGARVERARRAQARAADDHLVRIDSIVPRAHACHLCQVSLCCYWAPPTRAGARRRRGAWRRKPLGVGDRALSLDRAFMASRFKIDRDRSHIIAWRRMRHAQLCTRAVLARGFDSCRAVRARAAASSAAPRSLFRIVSPSSASAAHGAVSWGRAAARCPSKPGVWAAAASESMDHRRRR